MVPFMFVLILLFGDISEGTNLALNKPTKSSSVYSGATSAAAVDGGSSSIWDQRSCYASSSCDLHPWWQVDLQRLYSVSMVRVTVREDCCPERFHDVAVEMFKVDPTSYPAAIPELCNLYDGHVTAGETISIQCYHGPVIGRYVRLTSRASSDLFQFCEVQVLGTPVTVPPMVNLALNQPTKASSLHREFESGLAVDGSVSSFFHGSGCEHSPWWQVDLGTDFCIQHITVVTRSDCCFDRFRDVSVTVYELDPTSYLSVPAKLCTLFRDVTPSAGETISLMCEQPTRGRYVRFTSKPPLIQLAEVQIYGLHTCI